MLEVELTSPQVMYDLNSRWPLYPAQALAPKAIFGDSKRLIFMQCGRKFGKTTVALYLLVRFALTRPNAACYWFAPKAKQAREIIWASQRLQRFVPAKYIRGKPRETEMRVTYANGSFIKLDGSDEYEQYRGVEPDIAVCDEFKDFDHRFLTGFEPNLGPRQAPLVILGTPPRNTVTPSELQFMQRAEEARSRSDGVFIQAPSWERKDPAWIEELKKIYFVFENRFKQGDEDALHEWRCEYGAEFVPGGPGSIFPMFSREKHTRARADILSTLRHKMHDLDFWCVADPGTKHAFGVLFIALDKYDGRFYVLAEIKEKDQTENTTHKIYSRILRTIAEIYPYPNIWNFVYDEAALWFKAHVQSSSLEDYGWRPTRKAKMRSSSDEVKPYLSILKDCFHQKRIIIASECEEFISEVLSYKKDEEGKIPKGNDDLLDPMRYFLAESSFQFVPEEKELPSRVLTPQTDRAFFSPSSSQVDDILPLGDQLPLINLDSL